MLNKRSNILFDQKTWKTLVFLAKRQDTSVGDLVRSAVKEKYLDQQKYLKAQRAFNSILKIRQKQKGKVDYKALIEDGRKY